MPGTVPSEAGVWEMEALHGSMILTGAFPRLGSDEEEGWQREGNPRAFRCLLPYVGHGSGLERH